MPVRSHRRQAVVVAILAMAILLTVAGPQIALAKNPPGLGKFMNAIGQVESGGRYDARNKTSGAYGKYQIMPSNWPSWARIYLGNAKAKPTPANQEKVAAGKFRDLYQWLGSWRRVAYWWLTGSSRPTGWSPMRHGATSTRSCATTSRPHRRCPRLQARSSAEAQAQVQAEADGGAPPLLGEERSHLVHGPWKSARHGGYAGDARQVRDQGRRDGDAHVHRQDGSPGTAPSARPAARPGSRSTARSSRPSTCTDGLRGPRRGLQQDPGDEGAHTLTIEVLGTASHPMVAIDEFVVR